MSTHRRRARRTDPQQDLLRTELHGTIERVKAMRDSGWCLLRVRTDAGDFATVRGNASHAKAGERIICRGAWSQHPQYGRQFAAQQIQTAPPASADAIQKYLSSGIIEGIGPHYAQKLVAHFGEKLPEVLQNNPVYLESVAGIGPQRRRQIIESWQKQAHVRDVMMFLHQHGVGARRATQIHRRYGDQAISALRENPYRLADDLTGVGFTTADGIAQRVGISGEHEKRIAAGMRACMQRARSGGHCAVPQSELIQSTAKLLQISRDAVGDHLERLLDGHRLVREEFAGRPLIFTPSLRAAEVSVVAHIRRLQRHPCPWGPTTNLDRRIHAAAERSKLIHRADQFEAVRSALAHKVSILTGGPGCGKTTIVRLIVELLGEHLSVIDLCSFTGKATRRLSKQALRQASTIHRLLRGAPGTTKFGHDGSNPLNTQVLIVDESTMVDVELMSAVLEALQDGAALILVGDVDQLASVGPGQVLRDLIESGTVPVVRLTENQRQGSNSSVVRNACRVLRGLPPETESSEDFQWIIENDLRKVPALLARLVSRDLPGQYRLDPRRDIQTLSPMRKGPVGTIALNQILQRELSPNPTSKLVVGGSHFGIGDRLVHLTNWADRGVFNGDTGHLLRINESDRTFEVDYGDDSENLAVTYSFDEIDDLELANALSVHKSQGSEYPCVALAFASSHYPLLSKRLLYSAITRGIRVCMVGDERAVHIALNNERDEVRCTGLKERLQRAAAA